MSERQWGTVRQDYSDNGDAWNYFPHDQARSRAYRWGEDGIAGICDERQRLCLALALWNGADPILKDRMFGLTNGQGNHGEDVKEYWFYLDSTPTHSYMNCLYKYPQAAFPYNDLVETNGRRSKQDLEYELLDTGVFDEDRYFDVVVEYAKAAPDDILMLVTVDNRGPDEATLHVLPTLWFRNTWSWGDDTPRPTIAVQQLGASPAVHATHTERTGTKAAAHHVVTLAPGADATVRIRLTALTAPVVASPAAADLLGPGFDQIMTTRRSEADAFYAAVTPPTLRDDGPLVMRQALAGLLWGKQYYEYNVHRWLTEHGPPIRIVNDWNFGGFAARVSVKLADGLPRAIPDRWKPDTRSV